ncbi:MAG: hypothetical protein AAF316_14055 [Cyanobacteria bacterium P01_A01_bin.80]
MRQYCNLSRRQRVGRQRADGNLPRTSRDGRERGFKTPPQRSLAAYN